MCFSFLHTFLILSGSCYCLEGGTKEWISIRWTRHPILHNTRTQFWSMWRMNNGPNIDACQSINSKAYQTAIQSPLQWLQNLFNNPLIHMICPAMMKNTWRLTMWLRRHPDKVIALHADWTLPNCIWILRLKHQRTGSKAIQISMITTPTQWSSAVYFACWTWLTGGLNRRKHIQSTPFSPMRCARYFLSYHMFSGWKPVFPFAKMLSTGGSSIPEVKPFAEMLL